MFNKTTFIFLVALASPAAFAECDFRYYPEYADLFSQYGEVTPLMAKKAAMSNVSIDQKPGDIVCEPLLIKTVVGMPAYYMVATYNGKDLGVVRKWNALVTEINGGTRIPARELAERLAFFLDERVFRKFTWVSIPTYTFLGAFQAASGGIPPAFWGYEEAYEKAKELYGGEDFYFSRIIALGHAHVQAFEFVDHSGETVAIKVDKYERASIANLDEITSNMHDWVGKWYELFDADPDLIERNARRWREIELEVPDDAAHKEFPRIAEPLNTGSSGVLDDELEYISDCPDPKQQIVNICWAWAAAAVFVYHSQHTPNKANPTLGFTGWNKPIPKFDDGPWQTSPTQAYVTWLADEYYDLYNAMWPEHHPVVHGLSFERLALTTDQFVKTRGYEEKPDLWKMWRFEVWADWDAGDPPRGVYVHNFGIPWSTAILIKGLRKPICSGYNNFYGPNDSHACPLIGYKVEGTIKKGIYYDMNGEFYELFELRWWEEDGYPNEYPDLHEGIQMTVPQGPDIDPWVSYFTADRNGTTTILDWAVATDVDVKGFKLFYMSPSGVTTPVNTGLVPVSKTGGLDYSYTDEYRGDGGNYKLELIRNTYDEYRYFYQEGIPK